LNSLFKLASVINEQNDFIYRLESDTQTGNLVAVIDFCSELGGYPIYANNAYEWQLVQGKINIIKYTKTKEVDLRWYLNFRNNVKRSKF